MSWLPINAIGYRLAWRQALIGERAQEGERRVGAVDSAKVLV
jgi:hypothetical protein